MKRLLACVSLIAVTTTAAVSSTTPAGKPVTKPAAHPAAKAKLAPKIKVAPADEYFGKLKMSILGIRNTIKDVGANIDIDAGRWTSLVNKADFTEDAVRDWERKYPRDTWLARTIFTLERMYAKLDSDDGRKRSIATMNWLVHDFPDSPQAKIGKKELAAGRVGHPVGATASAATNASAAPAALASAVPGFGNPNPGSNVTPALASGGVAATPVPNPVPSLAPAPAASPVARSQR